MEIRTVITPTRLPFRLPEYTPRTTWASSALRELWTPRLSAISQAWQEMEWQTVANHLRPGALCTVTPDNLPAFIKRVASQGLVVLPTERVARVMTGYQSAPTPLTTETPWDYRCIITTHSHVPEWSHAHTDQDAMGRLLGYPDCCRQFFQRVWVTERWMDTTWPMADGHAYVSGLNMLWRWHGVRPVFHLPCSFTCMPSLMLASRFADLMQCLFPDESAWMRELLSLPAQWSALHGIAEITSTIHRTSVPTDATLKKLTVRYRGAEVVTRPVTSDPRANGFSSNQAMRAAHQLLLDQLHPPYTTVLDLGCGDGTLLSRIPCRRRVGIEIEPERAKAANLRLDRVIIGNCRDVSLVARVIAEERPDVILAQVDRNPITQFTGHRVLSYSYESGQQFARLIEP